MSEAIGGRWCGVQLQTRPGLRGPGNRSRGPCGGELLYRRRLEGERIVSYLVCQFCGHQTPMLACDTATGEHTNLTAGNLPPQRDEREMVAGRLLMALAGQGGSITAWLSEFEWLRGALDAALETNP